MAPVALLQCKGDLETVLSHGIELIDGFNAVKSPFIIKPNICISNDRSGYANTRVDIVATLIRLALKRDRNLVIKIVESDSESKYVDNAYKKFGYQRLVESLTDSGYDVSLVNLSHEPLVNVKLNGHYFSQLLFPKMLLNPGFFVSLGVAKTHGLTLVTGVLKNLFGLLPRKDQMFYHPHINDVIVDVNRLVKPDLCIIDARVGLEGWGGLNATPVLRPVHRLIIGRTPVSVDATMARIMGFDPETIRHIVETARHDRGSLRPQLLGESLPSSTIQFQRPPKLRSTALIN